MSHYVAFLRAINVAGHASVRMSDLREAFVAAGCRNVRTYIQSGNVLFESPGPETAATLGRVRRSFRDPLGVEPEILVRTVREIEAIIRSAPFKKVEAQADLKLT